MAANLFFPQLASGASSQYPIGKSRFMRTIRNVLADGSVVAKADPTANRLQWQFSDVELGVADTTALQTFFDSCAGPVHGFTFIDPTDNMLVSSEDLTKSSWIAGPLTITTGVSDPFGGSRAFTVTNASQITIELTQPVRVPANYQYCFSIYALGSSPIVLLRRGVPPGDAQQYSAGFVWTRLVSSGRLNDAGTALTVGVSLTPGQTISLYGPQLEAQLAPSRYRATTNIGGVYSNAHWAVEELSITAEAPNLFSASFSIEAMLQD